jgi:hypothetical protein
MNKLMAVTVILAALATVVLQAAMYFRGHGQYSLHQTGEWSNIGWRMNTLTGAVSRCYDGDVIKTKVLVETNGITGYRTSTLPTVVCGPWTDGNSD